MTWQRTCLINRHHMVAVPRSGWNTPISMAGAARLSIILAVSLSVFLAAPAAAQDVRLERPTPRRLVITSGTAGSVWVLQYGTSPQNRAEIVTAPGHPAYFIHGPWLRTIDVATGEVTGRWRFPGPILKLTPTAGSHEVDVRFQVLLRRHTSDRSMTFDPRLGNGPKWLSGSLLMLRVSETEALDFIVEAQRDYLQKPVTSDRARALVPLLSDMVRRDPFSPWLRVALGKCLIDAGETRGVERFAEAAALPNADFADLFRIANFLDRIRQPDASRAAFDAAFRDFLARGHDPRLMTDLISQLILYAPFDATQTAQHGAELAERVYRLVPMGEFANIAWRLHADDRQRQGDDAGARLWRNRAEATEHQSLLLATPDVYVKYDRLMLLGIGAALAVIVLIATLYYKYLPQRRLHALGSRNLQASFNLAYWSRRERAMLFVIAMSGWYAAGLASTYFRVMAGSAASPVSLGGLAGPEQQAFVDSLPDSPERTLLAAIVAEKSGDFEKAEIAYRALTEFAQSSNNLGVILQRTGRGEEARQAFEQALQINPLLPEANLNTGRPTNDAVMETYRTYAPTQPVTALLTREQMLRAQLGDSWRDQYAVALIGGFGLRGWREAFRGTGVVVMHLAVWLLAPAIVLSLIHLLIVPMRDVTQAPPRQFRYIELAVPGLAPAWGWWGCFAMIVWGAFLVALVLRLAIGSPYVVLTESLPGLFRSYGVSASPDRIRAFVAPPDYAFLVVAAGLYGLNFLLNRRSRKRAESSV